jgi:hypothetical protein
MTSLVQAVDELLAAEKRFVGYLPLRIPHELDMYPHRVVEAYLANVEERELIQAISMMSGRILAAYSERQASLAVRQKSENILHHAVIAVGLSLSADAEVREQLVMLPLLLNSAHLVGIDVAPFLDESTKPLLPAGRDIILAFNQRGPRYKSLQSMGFVEGVDEDGFRYRRTW